MIKKIVKSAALIVFIVLIAIQFWRPAKTTPPIVESETLEATTNVSTDVQAIMKRSCNDCHSNKTDYPWYSNVAPISWKVVQHIDEGREELNFSRWGTYNDKRKLRKLEEICEQIQERQMPHNQYLWIHRDAYLSESNIKVMCDWTAKVSGSFNEK